MIFLCPKHLKYTLVSLATVVALLTTGLAMARESRPMHLAGKPIPPGISILVNFQSNYVNAMSRPNYFAECPPSFGQGSCPEYILYINSHINQPPGCFDDPWNGIQTSACAPYPTSPYEPWPENNWPGSSN